MGAIEKYKGQEIVQDFAHFEAPISTENNSNTSLFTAILRRWYIVLITSLLLCSISIPAVWFMVDPISQVVAAIRVAPVISSILFSDKESEGIIPMYRNFMNTQADLMTNDKVLQRVADELVDKKLAFFEKPSGTVGKLKDKLSGRQAVDPITALREAFLKGNLSIIPEKNSELIKITMVSADPKEATQIVNSFVRAYMAIVVSDEAKGGDHKLSVLENEHRVLSDKLQRQRQTIRQMAEEYGSTVLTDRQEIMLQRVASLQAELTSIQTRRITLEAKQQLLQETTHTQEAISPDKLLKIRHEFINADTIVQALSTNISQLDQELIVAKQILASANPELKRKTELLEALKVRLAEKQQEMGKTFDDIMSRELARNHKDQLVNVTAELEQIAEYEKRLQDMLAKENAEAINLGRKHLAIQDQQEQLNLTNELYTTIRKRIQELEMERKRPARISVAYEANIVPMPNKRIKFTIVAVLASLACGILLAFLRDKIDLSVRTPEDITKRVGIRIIGTTVRSNTIRKSLLPQQVSDDYQNIRANLGLLDGGGIPNKLVITSAGMRDGKTTFAINLATSMARAGRKILLIDGDLRKPDIGNILNLPKESRGLQDVLFGKTFESVVDSVPSGEFDVLTADSRNKSDAFDLLSLPHVGKCLNVISAKYDHVIIDSPPVLAFPDALLWARLADGVILTSYAGQTADQDLRETLERLEQIGANVLGTILNNVHANYSYNRHCYGYYPNRGTTKRRHRKNRINMLAMSNKNKNNHSDQS